MGLLTALASRFVAGETLPEAVQAVKVLNGFGISATLDNLGEETTDAATAKDATNEYLRIYDAIEQKGLDCTASVKLTQVGLAIDPALAERNVRKILNRAKRYNNFLRIDMEGSAYTQATLDIFRRVYQDYGNVVGIVLQANLRRSMKDMDRLLTIGAQIRWCKGAYKEPEDIAFPKKDDVNDQYRAGMEKLLTSGIYHGIATHDKAMVRAAQKFADSKGIAKDDFEFQMLYGIERNLQRKLHTEHYGMRVYVPYGSDWLPYFSRRIMERKENLLFVISHFFKG